MKSLPRFIARRVDAFHEHRVKVDWGGRHLLRGRTPTPGDLVLQSNDYLAIARHPQIIAAHRAALGGGMGMMMSATFVQSENDPLRRAEATLAAGLGYDAGILQQSGFAANVGLIQAIATKGVPVYIDLLAHASLWEGIRSAGATAVPFRHGQVAHLERKVAASGPGIIAVDAIYSTNGSVAPLAELADVATRHGCALVVDESHSLGTHGPHGAGLVAALGLSSQVDFLTASLAKAYCARAGFIGGSLRFKEYFACEARPAVFSSALLPAEIAGVVAAHDVVRRDEWRRHRLRAVTAVVRRALDGLGYPIGDGSEHIIAFEIGEERLTAHVRDAFESRGVFGSVFSAPATPAKRSVLRFSLNAGMADDDVQRLIGVCAAERRRLRVDEWSGSRRARRESSVSFAGGGDA